MTRALRVLFAVLLAAFLSPAATIAAPLEYFPATLLYRPYVADPVRATFGVELAHVEQSGIPEASDWRNVLRLGGRLGLLGRGAAETPGSWQLTLDAGVNAQFDTRNSADNLGWDGIYGFTLAWVLRPDWILKAGTMHWSSHAGDEYIVRTGYERINYTRAEAQVGASWLFAPYWRAYGEYGRAYDRGNKDLQEPERVQLGIEYEAAPTLWSGRAGWYGAFDAGAHEERDWRSTYVLQAGIAVRADGRRWRFGFEHHRGRVPVGEFFRGNDHYTGIGVWMEL